MVMTKLLDEALYRGSFPAGSCAQSSPFPDTAHQISLEADVEGVAEYEAARLASIWPAG